MCQVYNTIGCLTYIQSHLRDHKLNEFQSLDDLINFQKNYSFKRKQIILNYENLIEEEKKSLNHDIARLVDDIKIKKRAAQQELISDIKKLKRHLANLPPGQSNVIQGFFNYLQKIRIKLKILFKKITFKSKIVYSLRHLTKTYIEKDSRYQYIVSHFEDAVMKIGLPDLQKHDSNKGIIDQINSFIYGALGEQKVVDELSKLSDDYILINDFNCTFSPPIYNRQENDYIKSIQIDHVLIAPSGIFLIETKNWSQDSLSDTSLYSPVHQIKRMNFALYKIVSGKISGFKLWLNKHRWGGRKIPMRNLIVFINHKPIEQFQFVKILTLNDLLRYIYYFEPCFSAEETESIANYLMHFMRK